MQTVSSKLVRRINADLPQVPLRPDAVLCSYRGPKDGGQMAWDAIDHSPRICSAETMTDLLSAARIACTTPDQYRSNGWEIGSA